MPRPPMRPHAQPEGRLLADVHANVFHVAVLLQKILATLIDQKFSIAQQVELMFDEPIASRAIDFLVAYSEENDITFQFYFFTLQHHHDHELRQAFILHILRAAAVNRAVNNLPIEGRDSPVRRGAGDHIHVVQQDDRPQSRRSVLRNSSPQISPACSIAEYTVLNAFAVEDFLKEVGREGFVPRRIRSVDPQVFPLPPYREIGVLLHPFEGNAVRGKPMYRGSLGPAEGHGRHADEPKKVNSYLRFKHPMSCAL